MLLHGVGPAREHHVAAWLAMEIPVVATLECDRGTVGHRHFHLALVEFPAMVVPLTLGGEELVTLLVDVGVGACPKPWHGAGGGGMGMGRVVGRVSIRGRTICHSNHASTSMLLQLPP